MLQMQVTYQMPHVDDAPADAYRLTVRAATVLDRARYYRLLAEVSEWLSLHTPAEGAEMTDDDAATFAVAQMRAYMLATLAGVEKQAGETWQPAELPAAWLSIDGMAREMPGELFEAWESAARACNPGLFDGGAGQGEAPRGVKVSVLTPR